jgi:hypothetical protein
MKMPRLIVLGCISTIAVGVMLWPTRSKTQTTSQATPTTAPFTVLNAKCNPVSREGQSAYHCEADIDFLNANYDAYGVMFHVTYATGQTEDVASSGDRHGHPYKSHEPLHRSVTVSLIDPSSHQAVAVKSVTVTPEFAIDTNSNVWGNKASRQVMSIGLRRAGFSEDVIASQKGMIPSN